MKKTSLTIAADMLKCKIEDLPKSLVASLEIIEKYLSSVKRSDRIKIIYTIELVVIAIKFNQNIKNDKEEIEAIKFIIEIYDKIVSSISTKDIEKLEELKEEFKEFKNFFTNEKKIIKDSFLFYKDNCEKCHNKIIMKKNHNNVCPFCNNLQKTNKG